MNWNSAELGRMDEGLTLQAAAEVQIAASQDDFVALAAAEVALAAAKVGTAANAPLTSLVSGCFAQQFLARSMDQIYTTAACRGNGWAQSDHYAHQRCRPRLTTSAFSGHQPFPLFPVTCIAKDWACGWRNEGSISSQGFVSCQPFTLGVTSHSPGSGCSKHTFSVRANSRSG